jgi:hypothetical protein
MHAYKLCIHPPWHDCLFLITNSPSSKCTNILLTCKLTYQDAMQISKTKHAYFLTKLPILCSLVRRWCNVLTKMELHYPPPLSKVTNVLLVRMAGYDAILGSCGLSDFYVLWLGRRVCMCRSACAMYIGACIFAFLWTTCPVRFPYTLTWQGGKQILCLKPCYHNCMVFIFTCSNTCLLFIFIGALLLCLNLCSWYFVHIWHTHVYTCTGMQIIYIRIYDTYIFVFSAALQLTNTTHTHTHTHMCVHAYIRAHTSLCRPIIFSGDYHDGTFDSDIVIATLKDPVTQSSQQCEHKFTHTHTHTYVHIRTHAYMHIIYMHMIFIHVHRHKHTHIHAYNFRLRHLQ